MFTYQLFYRKYGIRLLQQIMTPPTFEMMDLDLPMKSIYHYVTFDGVESGPPSDDYLFRNTKKPILVGHIVDIDSQLGNPRKQALNVNGLIRDYHNQHRRMRPLRNIQIASKDPTAIIVYNYCFINKTYKYIRSFFTEYFKWYNTFSAVITNIVNVSNESDNQHFLLSGCPKIIPSLTQLNLASNIEINQALLKVFNSNEAYTLLELWKWLSNDRSKSIFAKIPNNKLHLINIIYIESGKWCILNLGVLNSFRKSGENESNEGCVIESKLQLSFEQIQKRLLRMFMSIMELKTVTSNIEIKPEVVENTVSVLTGNVIPVESTDDTLIGDDIQTHDDVEESVEIKEELIQDIDQTRRKDDQQVLSADDEEYLNIDDELVKEKIKNEDDQLDKELTTLNDIVLKQEQDKNISTVSIKDIIDEPEISLEDSIINICDGLADEGLLTAGEYRRFNKLANSYKQIISPDGITPLNEFIKIKPEDLSIKESSTMIDNESVLDKTMLKSSLIDFDSRYIKNILAKDTANAVMSVQRAGIAVTNYKVETVEDILGGFEMHTIKLSPVEGLASTLRFKLPVINAGGSFESNGIKYTLRKQKSDLPIRKTNYNRVALTSYYGKVFINRGRKKSDDYGHWLQNCVMEKGLDKEDLDITEIAPANTFDNTLKAPRAYTALSMSFKSIKCRGFTLLFNRKDVLSNYPESVLNHFEKDGSIVIGSSANGTYLVLDVNGTIYTTDDTELKLFGVFEQFLGVALQNAPVEYVDLVVFGKEIPMGVILGYKIGLDNLIKLLKVTPRRVNAGNRLNLEANEYALAFSDETLIFSRDDRLASIILSGFNEYHRAIKLFSVYSFDKKGVYLNLLDTANLGVRYLREIDLMYNMFIDNITKDLLIEMKEPVTFQGLLFRACEMLLDDQHPDELDPKYMRIKGYERLSGAVYTELVQAIRVHNGKLGKSNQPIEMNPYAVWKRISEDPSKSQVNEINPIKALKETEAVTFAGTGGRNKRSMTAHTRAYHKNDMGTISESTVDSSDVAINVFTSADPQFNSLRGISKEYDFNKTGATALLSTSALLAPGSDRDDPKRVNFVAIQQEHSIACAGYHQPSVRTGYEQIVPQRSGDLFAMTAKKPGTVKSINENGIIVEYDDKEVTGYELGRRFGNAAGLTIPHSVVTKLKTGDRIELGDCICYNEGFFEPDLFNRKRVIFKNSTNVKTVLWESHQTLDDSSALSTRIADKLMTRITKVKTILIRFDQSISKLVKVGDSLESDDVLCIIEDSITSTNKLFDEQTLDTLKAVGAQTPRAHTKGIVEKVEIFYNGDKEDMSESLLDVVNFGNRNLKKSADNLNRKPFTGSVDGGFRIENDPLGLDCAAIRVYITTNVPASTGDKVVFVNQMKSVTGNILDQDYVTEDGTVLDAIFGSQSITARVVNSPYIIGTTTTLLNVIAKKAIKIYRS